ncbi:MAG: hypothetical protein ACREQR_01285 [Candidatus Binataceae bacterium]
MKSAEPSIRWKVMTRVLGEDPQSRKIKDLREEIRNSSRVRALLANRDRRFVQGAKVYAKYRGAHWTLAALADIGYPAGDESLLAMCDQVLGWWLSNSTWSSSPRAAFPNIEAPRAFQSFAGAIADAPRSRVARCIL